MEILKLVGIVYLALGVLYALFLIRKDEWYHFPINVLFGPIVALYLIYTVISGKKMPLG